MRLFIVPTDVLLFRTGRPFAAGEGMMAESLFPPTPETMQGALRALIASHWGTLEEAFQREDVYKLIGNYQHGGHGRFRLASVALGRRTVKTKTVRGAPTPGSNRPGKQPALVLPPKTQKKLTYERLFPVPAHLKPIEREGHLDFVAYLPAAQPNSATNMPDGLRPLMPKQDEPKDGAKKKQKTTWWLTETDLLMCLRGDAKEIHGIKQNAIWTTEPRIGIGMDNARSVAEDRMLYHAAMVRMNPGRELRNPGDTWPAGDEPLYGLIVDIHLVPGDGEPEITDADQLCQRFNKMPLRGTLALGAERRSASYEVIVPDESSGSAVAPTAGNTSGRTLLYFATPAYFRDGWRPKSWEDVFGIAPVAAAVPGMARIGGWTQEPGNAGGSSKSLRRCVPAGSVYFFEGSQPERKSHYTEYGNEIGYGYTIEGVW